MILDAKSRLGERKNITTLWVVIRYCESRCIIQLLIPIKSCMQIATQSLFCMQVSNVINMPDEKIGCSFAVLALEQQPSLLKWVQWHFRYYCNVCNVGLGQMGNHPLCVNNKLDTLKQQHQYSFNTWDKHPSYASIRSDQFSVSCCQLPHHQQ